MDSFEQQLDREAQSGLLEDRMTVEELDRAIRTADPCARLILPRILRRVIKQDRGLTGFALHIPHRKSYIIDRQPFLNIVSAEEIDLRDGEVLPEKLILLAQPDPQNLSEMSPGDALVKYWRLLFHARIHLAIQERIAEKQLEPAALREQIHRIGEVEFDEIRTVLGQEGFLLPPKSDLAVYEEFAAVFLELQYFAWNALERYFPALEDLEAVKEILRRDVDAQWIFLTTRPLDAPDPVDQSARDELGTWIGAADDMPPPPPVVWEPPSPLKYRTLLRRARRPESLGNVVGAAICHVKALRCAPTDKVDRMRVVVKDDVNRLIGRLQAALEIPSDSPQPWHESMRALVQLTTDGFWTAEARLLYDLQKVCVGHEREISKVDLAGWLISFGRRPIKRHLPNQRDVLVSQHLRSAERRLTAVRLSEAQRKHLATLIHDSIEHVELRLRMQFRPKIRDALETVGLRPENLPEQVAQKKIVEELLDRVVERGYLALGDLRDALSRNALKMPDIAEPRTLIYGDPLLQADRRLAELLDGVYRPAEFYLRWMQQLSSLAFGTKIGRFLTLNVAVPLGGSYLIIKGLDHFVGFFLKYPEDVIYYEKYSTLLLLSVFIFGLVNVIWFRKLAGQSLKDGYHSARKNIIEPVWHVIQSHIVQVILNSSLFKFSFRYFIKPAIWTFLAWLIFPLIGVIWEVSLPSAVSIFLAFNILLNSRVGQNVEEVSVDWTVQNWHRYGIRLFTGLFWLVVDFFHGVLEAIDRLMYSVDEWLRFRSGETSTAFYIKACLGTVWSLVAYILRFCVTLLIEPQINPIKHFPVVTVSHKLLLPLIPHLAWILETRMGTEKYWALTLASAIIFSIPGIFGFLVWELKENWRLYAANRKKGLSPVVVGEHGESMIRLIRPGLHSGKLPKIFAKLRKAERKARATGNWQPVRKCLHALEHFELMIRRYIEREFLALLAGSNCPGLGELAAKKIHLSSNRVKIFFARGGSATDDLCVAMEVHSGWLVGDVYTAGWAGQMQTQERQAIVTAILGLYKSAGMELVAQQIESTLSPPCPNYDIKPRGIAVYPDDGKAAELFYDLVENNNNNPQSGMLAPVEVKGNPISMEIRSDLELDRSQLMFREFQITWDRWVGWWVFYQSNPTHPLPPLAPFSVLPGMKEK